MSMCSCLLTCQWHPQTLQPSLDGFEVLRRGDTSVNCRIILHINHSPERFRVLPTLANLITVKEGTRAEIMAAVWKLVKVAGAQDKDDGSVLRPVGGFEKVYPTDRTVLSGSALPSRPGESRIPSTPRTRDEAPHSSRPRGHQLHR
jgi:SWI/SNF-related matrix-associated actin-dependent regulator of chromatin subfamily D